MESLRYAGPVLGVGRNCLNSSRKENKQFEEVINVTPKINQGTLIESGRGRGTVRKAPMEVTLELSQELELHPCWVCVPAFLGVL